MPMKTYMKNLTDAIRGKANPVSGIIASPWMTGWGDWTAKTNRTGVDYYKAVAAVYACVKIRADNIAKPPLTVYQVRKGESEAVNPNHPLQVLLDKVNPWWSRGQLWRATETSLCLWGSSFWVLYADGRGKPSEIWWLRPDRMRVVPSKTTYIEGYEYSVGAEKIKFSPEQIIWLRYFNPDDEFSGLSPISAARLSIDSNYDAMLWNRRFFQNDATPGRTYLKTEQALTPEQAEQLQIAWAKQFRGVYQAHRLAVMGQGADIKALGISQRDMEFIALQRFTMEDICRIYRVPPPMIADLERATYSNIKEAKSSFWHETMLPELQFIKEELNEMLVSKFGNDLYADFDLSDIEALHEDANVKATRYVQLVQSGIRTINEVRADENMPPVAWGDSWWVSIALYPAASGRPETPAEEGKAKTKGVDIDYTDDELKRCEVFVKRLTPMESKLKIAMRELFVAQEKRVLKRLEGQKQAIQNLWDWAEEQEYTAKTGLPFLRAMLAEGAAAQAVELAISFDLTNPLVQKWLGQRTKLFAKQVTETTGEAIAAQLKEGHLAGESIPEIAERIKHVFTVANDVRAERIARTEMVSSSNRGAKEAMRQSGVVKKNQWLAAIDERTRPAHLAAHRQIVGIDEKFIVGGEELDEPGDINGSPGNTINCRCTLRAIIEAPKMMKEARCPDCGKLLIKGFSGELQGECPRCKKALVLASP